MRYEEGDIQKYERLFSTEQACIEYLEKIRWNGNVISPFDPTSKVYKRNDSKFPYRCSKTGKNFNVRTVWLFENSKLPLKVWFDAFAFYKFHTGISSYKLAKWLNVTQKTAWYILDRMRQILATTEGKRLFSGEIEIDETQICGKNRFRHSNKKIKGSYGWNMQGKIGVLGIHERSSGDAIFRKVSSTSAPSALIPHIIRNVEVGSTIYTDELEAYNKLDELPYIHKTITHSKGHYVDGATHTQRTESGWKYQKHRYIAHYYGRFSHDRAEHYIAEWQFFWNERKKSLFHSLNLFLSHCNKRIPLKPKANRPRDVGEEKSQKAA